MTLQHGTRLGHYEITSLLGSGGMGEVFRAKDHKLGRDVAIKVLREELATDPERLRRFEQEARSASALNHPNIITIHDIRLRRLSDEGYGGQVGKTEDVDFIVMEFVEGRTLREMLAEGPLPTKKLLQLATQIAEGLAKAHSAGIIHRDLKPENLMVTSDGYVKILDFGLAKLLPEAVDFGSEEITVSKELTRAGVILGTVGYMSPEQASGRPLDHRSDQFSFGSILYEMATGKIAFKRETAAQMLAAIIEGEAEPIAKVNPNVPPHLRVIVERCLEKNPQDRYESTRDLARELESLREIPLALPAILTRRTVLAGVSALVVLGIALLVGLNVGGLRDRLLGGASAIESIAVLPLQNLSGDPEQEYFADGMTEALITDLAKIGALKVISRSSSMRYKGTDKTLSEIARELNVDAVVEGSTLRVDESVRIMAQLIDPETEQALWAESYEQDLENVLLLWSEVAQAIAGEVQVALTPEETKRLASARPVDPEVYDACLKGSYHHDSLTREDLDTAESYFELALEKDPSYAPAYAGLASVWAARRQMGFVSPDEGGAKANAAALQAVALDDSSAIAHQKLAVVRTWTDWDWAGAEPEWRRALELDPNAANTHRAFALFLAITGRIDEAIPYSERAIELDPFNALSHAFYAQVLHYDRRYDDAIAAARTAMAMQPSMPVARLALQWVLFSKGMRDEWMANQREWIARDPELLEAFEQGLAEAGYEGAQRRIADIMAARFEESGSIVGPAGASVPEDSIFFLAQQYLYASDYDRTLDWLEKSYEARIPDMWYIAQPLWDPLRSDPRFQDLMRRMNLPTTANGSDRDEQR